MEEKLIHLAPDEQAQLHSPSLKPGQIVVGVVVDIRSDVVVVNAGLKSKGIVPIEQFRNERGKLEVAIGDEVKVALDSLENGFGETMLSREKAKRSLVWDELEEAQKANATVTGRISGKVKGGFTVDIKDVRAFLPAPLVDVRSMHDPVHLEGKALGFKIVKVDRKRNNVIVSRRAVVDSEFSSERESLLEKLQEGAVIKGVVTYLTDYGAFVDLGGIEGLLHITDIAWMRVPHPSEVVNVGDELDVRVLKFDRERNRVSLGLKQLSEDPWVNIARRYPTSTRMFGKVSNVIDYGCFVELEPGVEGLVHVSEMDWTNKNINPGRLVQVGDEVPVMVLDVDEERRRILLSIKQAQSNPWETFAAVHKKNDKVRGVIKSITDFGIFVGLDGGIDGLVQLSDISWQATGEDLVRQFKKGDEVDAVILAVDPVQERILLGLLSNDTDVVALVTQVRRTASIGAAISNAHSLRLAKYVALTEIVEVALEINIDNDLSNAYQFLVEQTCSPIICRLNDSCLLTNVSDEITLLGLFPSGAVRTVGEAQIVQGGLVNMRPFSYWDLLDPDASGDSVGKKLHQIVALVAVRGAHYAT